jgi:hypothetical protein
MAEVTFKENIHGYKVLTPDGYKSFVGIRCLGTRPICRVEFEQDYWLECTNNHKLFIDDTTRVPLNELTVGDIVLSKNGEIKIIGVTDTGKTQLVYDLVEVEGGHRYYTNGVLSSNCEFIIFDETLINPLHLVELAGIDPIEKQGQVRWYKKPEKGYTYAVGLDPSLGTGGDYAALQVVELPSMKQVAEWQHNKTPIQKQVGIMKEVCQYIYDIIGTENNIYYSVENNTLGEAALVTIAEMGEENIRGTFLSEPKRAGVSRVYRKGFTTSNKSKISVCAKLKALIENKRLHIASNNLISELKNFVAHGTSFAAKIGETDDLVMSMLLCVRMIQLLQTFDAELDESVRNDLEDFIDPMPFVMLAGF